jgi:hypothetical protein
MKKEYSILLLLMLFSAIGFAQKGNLNSAQKFLQDGQILKAKTAIDEVMQNAELQVLAKSWKLKGEIYQAIYEDKITNGQYPNALKIAKDSYINAYQLEINPKEKADLKLSLDGIFNYLYNEGAERFNAKEYEDAYTFFKDGENISQFMFNNKLSVNTNDDLVFAIAITSFNLKDKEAESISKMEQLVNMSYKNQFIYETLVDKYETSKQTDRMLPILEKGLKLFPDSKKLQTSKLNYYYNTDAGKKELVLKEEEAKILKVKQEEEQKKYQLKKEAEAKQAILFEENRKTKLKNLQVGDRVSWSQGWKNTDKFFGFTFSETNYNMNVICYIENVSGDRYQIRVANIKSTSSSNWEYPELNGVPLKEGTLHWIKPSDYINDKSWHYIE